MWALFYIALALVATWPVPTVLTTRLPHDLGDPVMSATLLRWNATVPIFSQPWWNGVGFYPLLDTLTFSDTRLGMSLISTPVFWLTGSIIAGYNVLFILSFAFCAISAHTLVFSLTRSHPAALVAGCAYGFSPYRAAHLAHLELLASYWMPVGLPCLHRWLEQRAWWWLVLVAAAVAAQGLFCAYYLPMFGVFAGCWLLWFAAGRVKFTQLSAAALALVLGAVLLAPLFAHYRRAQEAMGFSRTINEIEEFSADVSSIWSPPPELKVWPSLVQHNTERFLFPGLTIVLLIAGCALRGRSSSRVTGAIRWARRTAAIVATVAAIAALVATVGPWRLQLAGVTLSLSRFHKPLSVAVAALAVYSLLHPRVVTALRERHAFAFYALAAALMFVLALGPSPRAFGVTFLYKAPYSWLMLAPGFGFDRSLRVPARFGMLMALALAVASGLAWHRLSAHQPARRARWMTAAVAGLIVAEGWIAPVSTVVPPSTVRWPAQCDGTPRLELPVGYPEAPEADAAAQYRALLDGTRSVNGLSGYMPPYLLALTVSTWARDADALTALAEHGPICISVARSQRDGPALADWVARHPLARTLGARHGQEFFALPQSAPQAGRVAGVPLPISVASSDSGVVDLRSLTDGRLATQWITPGPQRRNEQLRVTLACVASIGSIGLSQDVATFPRELAIEASPDGTEWQTLWQGTTGGLTMRAALRDPHTMTTDFTVRANGIRHVRFRILRDDPIARWAVADLTVRGHCEGD